MNYFKKKATPWVAITVLFGGMVSALLLFWIVNLEGQVDLSSVSENY